MEKKCTNEEKPKAEAASKAAGTAGFSKVSAKTSSGEPSP